MPYLTHGFIGMYEAGRSVRSVSYQVQKVVYPSPVRYPLVTEYQYDGQGHATVITDTKQHTISYTYESSGWLVGTSQVVSTQNEPQTLITRYSYESGGQPHRYHRC